MKEEDEEDETEHKKMKRNKQVYLHTEVCVPFQVYVHR